MISRTRYESIKYRIQPRFRNMSPSTGTETNGRNSADMLVVAMASHLFAENYKH